MNTLIHYFTRGFLALFVMLYASVSMAHNKVVVIPMAGDESEPFALIPADDVRFADYTLANGVALHEITGLEWQQVGSNDDNFEDARDYCLSLTLDGKIDWRLPTIQELLSIVDFGTFNPAINRAVFSTTEPEAYWSNTEYLITPNTRWTVNFLNGSYSVSAEGNTLRLRCVRSNGKNALLRVFKNNGNGSISDLASGLAWQRQTDATTRNHVEAISYCQNLVLAGSGNWRLPGLKELASIVDLRTRFLTIDSQLFPTANSQSYWSAPSDSSSLDTAAWSISFLNGSVQNNSKSANLFVRCVR